MPLTTFSSNLKYFNPTKYDINRISGWQLVTGSVWISCFPVSIPDDLTIDHRPTTGAEEQEEVSFLSHGFSDIPGLRR
jgi:hypothetical protein